MSWVKTLGVLVLTGLQIGAGGCRARSNPQAVYDQISESILHGEYDSASSAADRALSKYGTDPLWLWKFRILKARVYIAQSADQPALNLLRDDLPASLSTTDIAVRRSMLQGMAYRAAQDFDASEKKLLEAQDLAARYKPDVMCEVLNAQGSLEGQQGDFVKAETTYQQALSLARQYGRQDQVAVARVGLAWISSKRERFDEAVQRGLEALDLSRSLGMQGFVATALGNLGWSYAQLGDFVNGLEYYKKAAESSDRLGLRGYRLYWLTGVANSYDALHDYSSAETLSKSTLDLARSLKNTEIIAECLNDLSSFELRGGNLDEAEHYNQEAMSMENSGADHFGRLDALMMSGRIAARRKQYSKADGIFDHVLRDSKTDSELKWEVFAALGDLRDEQGQAAQAESRYLEAIDTIERARRSINHDELRLSFLSSGIAAYGQYIDFLIRHGRSADALMQAELSRARTLGEGLAANGPATSVTLRSFQPDKIAQRLKATLLFYWMGEKQSYLWVVTPMKTTRLTLPSADEIDSAVKSYREALLGSGDPLESANADGQKLYEMLIEPAKNLLPQGSRVILLPDGSLYGLNFETLIVPGPKPHYWIEDATVTTASSLTLLASAAGARPAPKVKSIFLVGDTVSPNADFPALPQAAAEMQKIEKYFPEPRREVLSGSAATPAAYLSSKPEQYAYLHFVTHGTASRARPLESAVVLSKEKDEDSYKLYARDIVKRRLSAYLVTISACNGAGTRAFSGEGLVGLSWAFLRAGAHNVIGALWEVSDSAAPQLMDVLYDDLSHGQDPATALRAAKLSLLHSDNVFRKPYYWAPFQLYAGS
ncbi:MAG TPA: CHAT domain-containing tetratricopeptide repeat protein [Candidatus Acidoferrum sp.]|nr:CHAT domain-containing tetratricopeptide repeat protein [Candidatus Acidoferrum sp.]